MCVGVAAQFQVSYRHIQVSSSPEAQQVHDVSAALVVAQVAASCPEVALGHVDETSLLLETCFWRSLEDQESTMSTQH